MSDNRYATYLPEELREEVGFLRGAAHIFGPGEVIFTPEKIARIDALLEAADAALARGDLDACAGILPEAPDLCMTGRLPRG